MAVWNILETIGIFNDYLAHFVFILYMFPGFGIMYQEKSGNPAPEGAPIGGESVFISSKVQSPNCIVL
jgi:hypothetical protein